ncbi:hypothetical protein DXG01_016652, partial [Tephrocybe rancida]
MPEYAPCTAAADAEPRVENRRRGGVMSADGLGRDTAGRSGAASAKLGQRGVLGPWDGPEARRDSSVA